MEIDALKLLRELVAIPSANPMGVSAAGPVEAGVADHLEAVLRRAGVDCERQPVADGRENLVAIVSANTGASSGGILLASHMDTVPVANMTVDPFDPVVRDGRLYGRGSCDAKGSLAAMVAALVAHAARSERRTPVVFAATVDEEYAFTGAWRLIERELPVTAAVVGEPTRLACVVAHMGIARWRLTVRGRSAHGATPHLGRSAIYDGARLALALERHAAQLAGGPAHRLLGAAALNVGRVVGGQAVNVVPDRCGLELERRLLPGEDAVEAVRACEAWLRRQVPEADFAAEAPYLVDPPLETSPDGSVALAVRRAHGDELGAVCPVEGAHYGTDASKLAGAGIETVVCGPGDIAKAHTRDEFLDVDELERGVRVYRRLLERWPAEPRGESDA